MGCGPKNSHRREICHFQSHLKSVIIHYLYHFEFTAFEDRLESIIFYVSTKSFIIALNSYAIMETGNAISTILRNDVYSSFQLSGGGVLGRDGCIYVLVVMRPELGGYDYWLLKFDTQIAHIALLEISMVVCMMVGGILLQGTMDVSAGLPWLQAVS